MESIVGLMETPNGPTAPDAFESQPFFESPLPPCAIHTAHLASEQVKKRRRAVCLGCRHLTRSAFEFTHYLDLVSYNKLSKEAL